MPAPRPTKLRVAFLTHEPFYPPSGGGSAEAIFLVREWVNRGHELHLFAPRSPDPESVQPQFGVVFHPFTAWPMGRYTSWRNLKYLAYPLFLKRLVRRVARTIPFDLILSQHSISAVAAGGLKRELGVPVVMNFLDYLTAFMETWPAYLAPPAMVGLLKHFELSIPNRYQADAVLTVSDVLADHFAATGFPRDRLLPIYFGYDDETFVPAVAPAPRAEPPIVVMHGSLDHHHLGDIAGEALAEVARQRPEVRFRLVGQPTAALRKFTERVRKRTPQAHLECPGFVSYFEVARHLASSTVGIVPYEASAGVHCAFVAKAVEYLAVGLPVVSTPLQGLKRYFAQEPLLRFSTFNGREFGQEILRWFNEPIEHRQQWAEAASRRVKAELSWKTICRRAVDFAEATVRSKSPA